MYTNGENIDEYAQQTARQNRGGWCKLCGSISGHYDFCECVRGMYGNAHAENEEEHHGN